MESIDRLREWMENATAYGPSINGEFPRKHAAPWFGWKSDIEALIDAIEQEVDEMWHALTIDAKPMTDENMAESGWVRMPKDAEGEPIHIGDVMETPDGETFEVSGIFYTANEVMVDSVRFDYDPDEIIHHHAPTVEDVLREFAEKVTDSQIPGVHPTYEEAIAEYAKRLRLAGDE